MMSHYRSNPSTASMLFTRSASHGVACLRQAQDGEIASRRLSRGKPKGSVHARDFLSGPTQQTVSTLLCFAFFCLMLGVQVLSAGVSKARLVVVVSNENSDAPVISSVEPRIGLVGTAVTLSGVKLSGVTHVSFGGTPVAGFSIASDQMIVTQVPAGASTGRIEIGAHNQTATSSKEFVVVYAPAIGRFTPASGPAGTDVTLYGRHFLGVTEIFFNDTAVPRFAVVADSVIQTTVPSGAPSGLLRVVNAAGVALSDDLFKTVKTPGALELSPRHDSFVRSSRPDGVYGDVDVLTARRNQGIRSTVYLKFKVVGLGVAPRSAQLHLHALEESREGGSLFLVSNSSRNTEVPWTETNLTWTTAPVISGAPLGAVGNVSPGDTLVYDVGKVIIGDGEYSFALTNDTSEVTRYSSREGLLPPRLVIEPGPRIALDDSTDKVDSGESFVTDVDLDDEAVPHLLTIRPNYPNPFNLTTRFEYGLPHSARVELIVYNLLGQFVRRLVDEEQSAGEKRVLWDGRDQNGAAVASGVFFMHLRVGHNVLIQRVTLQK